MVRTRRSRTTSPWPGDSRTVASKSSSAGSSLRKAAARERRRGSAQGSTVPGATLALQRIGNHAQPLHFDSLAAGLALTLGSRSQPFQRAAYLRELAPRSLVHRLQDFVVLHDHGGVRRILEQWRDHTPQVVVHAPNALL